MSQYSYIKKRTILSVYYLHQDQNYILFNAFNSNATCERIELGNN